MSKNSTSGSAKGKAKAATNEAIEEIKLASNQLVDRVRDLIEEGNVRHVKIKKEGRVLLEVPMTVGVGAGAAAVLLSPMLAAVGALAALVTDVTLVIERDPDADSNGGSGTPSSSGSSGGGSSSSGSSGGSSSGDSDKATGEPTETPASKPVTPPDAPGKTIGK